MKSTSKLLGLLILSAVAVSSMFVFSELILATSLSTYDYTSGQGSSHFVYEGSTVFPPVWTSGHARAGTEISDYTNIQSDNGNYIQSVDYGSNFEPFFRFNFTISEAEGDVEWIYWHIDGYAVYGGGEDADCYIANFDTPAWEKVCDLATSDGATTECPYNISSSVTSYIDASGQVVATCVGKNMDDAGDFSIDYVNITVGYTSDITKPQITYTQPWNITYPNNTINFNMTGNEVLDWAAVEISGHNNSMTNQSGEWNYLNNTLSDGAYEATFWFNDSAGNMNFTRIVFTIDTTYPWFSSYTNTTFNEDQDVEINLTVYELNPDTCYAQWESSTNYTLVNKSGVWGVNIESGNYTAHDTVSWMFWCNDTASNGNWSTNQSTPVPNQIPTLTSVSANVSDVKQNDWVRITSSGAGDSDAEDTYYLGCGDSTGTHDLCIGDAGTGERTCDFQVTWTDDASHDIYCTIDDAYDNSTEQTTSVTTDNTVPTFNTYTNTSFDEDTNVDINVTVNELNSDTCYAQWESSANYTLTNKTGVWGVVIESGNYTAHDTVSWLFWCNDSVGNGNWSENQTAIVTNQKPTLTSVSSNISVVKENDWVRITSSGAGDNDAEDTYYLGCGDSSGTHDLCIGTAGTGERTCDFQITWTDNIAHDIYCTIDDSRDNSTEQSTSVTADNSKPSITIFQPWNVTYDNSTINFNITGNETLDWVNVEISGHNNTNFTNQSGEWNYLNDTLDNGVYTAIFWYNDTVGNTNFTNITFTIDVQIPKITILKPWNVTYNNNTVNFNITGDTVLDWVVVQIGNTNHTLTNQSGEWNYLNDTLHNGVYTAIFWFNGTSGNMNFTNITFTILMYGKLIVDITSPLNYSNFSQYDENLTINASIKCIGTIGGSCGDVYAYLRYNLSSDAPDTFVNTTFNDTPFNTYDFEFLHKITGLAGNSYGLAFSDKYGYIAFSAGLNLYVYDVSNWTQKTVITGDGRYDPEFSPDGKYLLAGDNDDNLYIYSTSNWSLIKTLTDSSGNTVDPTFSPDGTLLAYGGGSAVFIHNVSDWALEKTYITGVGSVQEVDFSPDGELLASVDFGANANVTIVNTDDWLLNTSINTTDLLRTVKFSPDGKILAFGGLGPFTGTVEQLWIYNTTDWTSIINLTDTYNNVGDISFSSDNKLLAYSSGTVNTIYIYNVSDWVSKKNVTVSGDAGFASLGFSPDDNYFVFISDVLDRLYIHNMKTNPKTYNELEVNEIWNVSWNVNITTADAESYLLDVFFNSSYGNTNVPNNETDDLKVNLNIVTDISFFLKYPDNNLTISTAAGNTSDVNFEYNTTDGQDKNVSACIVGNTIKCQTLSIGNYKFNNSGDTNIKWIAKLNETLPSSIEIWATLTSSAGTNVIPINDTVWAEINASISADAEEEAWFWVNFTDAVYADTIVIQIYHNSTEA